MKTMPQSTIEEKFRWIKPVLDKDISIKNMSKVCPFSERTLKYWLVEFREGGVDALEDKSRRPKSNPKETPIRTKERIIELRNEKKQCALKIMWDLEDEGTTIHFNTIQKIIKAEGLTRKYRSRKAKIHYVKKQWQRGEMIEIDVKWVPGRIEGERYYQFTAIDMASKWRYMEAHPFQSNAYALMFLKTLIRIAPFAIKAVKTDNACIFTNHAE